PGIRYSDGTILRASDIRRGIERSFSTAAAAAGLPRYLRILVGGEQCFTHPGPCHLDQGIVTDDKTGTITFHLTAPDSDFLGKLAPRGVATARASERANGQTRRSFISRERRIHGA